MILGAVIYMVVSSLQSGEALVYYKHVDEVVGQRQKWSGRGLQLHGNVVEGSILKKPDSMDFKFALHKNGKWLEVAYRGLVPDTFKDCAEVVVKGKLSGQDAFAADEITAKCPSKYEGKLRKVGCGESLKQQVQARRQGK